MLLAAFLAALTALCLTDVLELRAHPSFTAAPIAPPTAAVVIAVVLALAIAALLILGAVTLAATALRALRAAASALHCALFPDALALVLRAAGPSYSGDLSLSVMAADRRRLHELEMQELLVQAKGAARAAEPPATARLAADELRHQGAAHNDPDTLAARDAP